MAPAKIQPLKTETLARILPILTGVVAFMYLLAAYAFLFIPKLGRMVSGGDLDLAPLEARIAESDAYVASLDEMQKQYLAVDAGRRARVQHMIPVTADAQSLYVLLDEVAKANAAVLGSIDVSSGLDAVSDRGLYVVRGSVSFEGIKYDQFKRILNDLERSERLIDVQGTVFSATDTSFSVTFRAYAFDERRLRLAPAVPVPGAPPTQ